MQSLNTWTDLSGFSALRLQAQADSKAALPVVAKQFESIFTQMVLKSMRDASPGDPLFQSQAGDAWQGMFDQQLSVSLSGKALMIGSMLLVMIVELLNSAIEATVDRISLENHQLAKRAKDIGSAAVFLSLVNLCVVWLLVIFG